MSRETGSGRNPKLGKRGNSRGVMLDVTTRTWSWGHPACIDSAGEKVSEEIMQLREYGKNGKNIEEMGSMRSRTFRHLGRAETIKCRKQK